MTDASDDHLMSAYAAGDASAFEQLYARHHAGLYRFIRRLLGPALSAQTDEVFQDTWLRVVQARAQWQPQGASFRTWLYTLANHRVIDLWRRSGREVSLDLDDEAAPWEPEAGHASPWQHWPGAPPAAPPSEDLGVWRRAGGGRLQIQDELPLPQRRARQLHHDDGLPLDDVARALEVGFETAKTRLRYAMSKLRTCMGAYLSPLQGDSP